MRHVNEHLIAGEPEAVFGTAVGMVEAARRQEAEEQRREALLSSPRYLAEQKALTDARRLTQREAEAKWVIDRARMLLEAQRTAPGRPGECVRALLGMIAAFRNDPVPALERLNVQATPPVAAGASS